MVHMTNKWNILNFVPHVWVNPKFQKEVRVYLAIKIYNLFCMKALISFTEYVIKVPSFALKLQNLLKHVHTNTKFYFCIDLFRSLMYITALSSLMQNISVTHPLQKLRRLSLFHSHFLEEMSQWWEHVTPIK